jgi:hypothetical protein
MHEVRNLIYVINSDIRIPCKSSYQDIPAPFSTVRNNILQAQYVEFLNRFSMLKS